MTKECKYIIEFLNCEYELFKNEVNDISIINRYNTLRTEGIHTGFTPLIIVPSNVLCEQLDMIKDEYGNKPESISKIRRQIIADSETVDVQVFFEKKYKEYLPNQDKENDITGSFMDCEPSNCFYSYMNGKSICSEIIIAKIPTGNPWELAAWVPMGGFNECPSPAEQVAVFKYWYEKYKAVPSAVTYDVWEMELETPPTNNETAEALAKEHFAFCMDCVYAANSGFDSIRGLASTIKNAATWYFWWD